MTPEEFNQMSDAIMLPMLEEMTPDKRKKLLLVLRKTVHPRAYAWIDAQLAALESAEPE